MSLLTTQVLTNKPIYHGYAKTMIDKGIGIEAFEIKLKNEASDYLKAVREARKKSGLSVRQIKDIYGNHFSCAQYQFFEQGKLFPFRWECCSAAFLILGVAYPKVTIPAKYNQTSVYKKRLGAFFKSAREFMKLSRYDVEDRLGISHGEIAYFENGASTFQASRIVKLMCIYKLTELPLLQTYDESFANYGMEGKEHMDMQESNFVLTASDRKISEEAIDATKETDSSDEKIFSKSDVKKVSKTWKAADRLARMYAGANDPAAIADMGTILRSLNDEEWLLLLSMLKA